MNTITIELCAEDRARLDAILDALKGFKAPSCDGCIKSALEYVDAAVQEAKKQPQEAPKDKGQQEIEERLKAAMAKASEPAPVKPAPEDAPRHDDTVAKTPEPAPDVSISELQGLVIQLAKSGKKAEARDIVKAYAERLTEIPPEKYGEVFVKLKALEG